MPNPLLKFLNSLTVEQRATFAEAAKSSPGSLRLAAHGYKTGGKLDLTPEFAGRLASASGGALRREQLSDTCAHCAYVPKCK
jgi:hypothetical protein